VSLLTGLDNDEVSPLGDAISDPIDQFLRVFFTKLS
jgi:hypothetical protein